MVRVPKPAASYERPGFGTRGFLKWQEQTMEERERFHKGQRERLGPTVPLEEAARRVHRLPSDSLAQMENRMKQLPRMTPEKAPIPTPRPKRKTVGKRKTNWNAKRGAWE